jgi:hypothetical protein
MGISERSCADDPIPISEIDERREVQFVLGEATAVADVME